MNKLAAKGWFYKECMLNTTKDSLDIKSPFQKIGIFFRRARQVPKVIPCKWEYVLQVFQLWVHPKQ